MPINVSQLSTATDRAVELMNSGRPIYEVREPLEWELYNVLRNLAAVGIAPDCLINLSLQQRKTYASAAEDVARAIVAFFEQYCTVRYFVAVAYRVLTPNLSVGCIHPSYLREIFWALQKSYISELDVISYCALISTGSMASAFKVTADTSQPSSPPLRPGTESVFDNENSFYRSRHSSSNSLLSTVAVFKTEIATSRMALTNECFFLLLTAELLNKIHFLSPNPDAELEFESLCTRAVNLSCSIFNNIWARVSQMGVELQELWVQRLPESKFDATTSSLNIREISSPADFTLLNGELKACSTSQTPLANTLSTLRSEFDAARIDISMGNPGSAPKRVPLDVLQADGDAPVTGATLQPTNEFGPAKPLQCLLAGGDTELTGKLDRSLNVNMLTSHVTDSCAVATSKTPDRTTESCNTVIPTNSTARLRVTDVTVVSASNPLFETCHGKDDFNNFNQNQTASVIRHSSLHTAHDQDILLILATVASKMLLGLSDYCNRLATVARHPSRTASRTLREKDKQPAPAGSRQHNRQSSNVSTPSKTFSQALKHSSPTMTNTQLSSHSQRVGSGPSGAPAVATGPSRQQAQLDSLPVKNHPVAAASVSVYNTEISKKRNLMQALTPKEYALSSVETFMYTLYTNMATWSSFRHVVMSLLFCRTIICRNVYSIVTICDAAYSLEADAGIRTAIAQSYIGMCLVEMYRFLRWIGESGIRTTSFYSLTMSNLGETLQTAKSKLDAYNHVLRKSSSMSQRVSQVEASAGPQMSASQDILVGPRYTITESESVVIQIRVWCTHIGSKLVYGGNDLGTVPHIFDIRDGLSYIDEHMLWPEFEPNEVCYLLITLWCFDLAIFGPVHNGANTSSGTKDVALESSPSTSPFYSFLSVLLKCIPMTACANPQLQKVLHSLIGDLFIYIDCPSECRDQCISIYNQLI